MQDISKPITASDNRRDNRDSRKSQKRTHKRPQVTIPNWGFNMRDSTYNKYAGYYKRNPHKTPAFRAAHNQMTFDSLRLWTGSRKFEDLIDDAFDHTDGRGNPSSATRFIVYCIEREYLVKA